MRAPEFWSRSDALSWLAAFALSPLGLVYGASVAWKAGRGPRFRPKAKVVCIGGLTAGGSGKTPVAIAVGKAIAERGMKPVFLTRGYGGRLRGPLLVDPVRHTAREVGDESLLLSRTESVVLARDRRRGAALADSRGFDVVVMDDGHQNFQLAKDLSIVVVDAADPFGNGRMIPAGPLREPVGEALSRADAVVMLGGRTDKLGSFAGAILRANMQAPARVDWRGARILAFAGIGRPAKFFEMLRALGADLVDSRAYADHHAYTASEVALLKAAARERKARLMTTEKDFVRMTPEQREGIDVLPVTVVFEDLDELSRLVDRISKPR
jgi:tetraacyldisaccharide 4'-kinase